MEQNRKVFDLIKDADAIVHVVRGFEDESVSIRSATLTRSGMRDDRDGDDFGDLELVEKRLERMELGAKRGRSLMRARKSSC